MISCKCQTILQCGNCKKVFKDVTEHIEPEFIEDEDGDIVIKTIINVCPCCDDDWEKNCGVDLDIFVWIKNEVSGVSDV